MVAGNMPVTYTIVADTAEELAEPLRKVAQQKDGKFVVAGLPEGFAVEDVRGLRSTVGKLRQEIDANEPPVKALQAAGITKPEDIGAAVDALSKVKAGSLKTNDEIERFKADASTKHANELTAERTKLEKRTKQTNELLVRGRLAPVIAAKGGSRAIDAILLLASQSIRVKEDAEGNLSPVIVGHDGQPRLTKKVGSMEPMGFDELDRK